MVHTWNMNAAIHDDDLAQTWADLFQLARSSKSSAYGIFRLVIEFMPLQYDQLAIWLHVVGDLPP